MKFSFKSLLLLSLVSSTFCSCAFSQTMPKQNQDTLKPAQPSAKQVHVDGVTVKLPPLRHLGNQTVGYYNLQLVAAPAMGSYQPSEGQLVWMPPPPNTNVHLEVILTNVLDKRPLPGAGVTVSIYDQNNKLIESKAMNLVWSIPGYHYGNNFSLPAAGNYTVQIDITPPMFNRHHKPVGNRFFSTSRATFKNVSLKPEGCATE